jgi:uncharacterized protein YndB with AHSA1/START domain
MEEYMDRSTFIYQLYIGATPEKIWEALTNPDMTVQYWAHRNISDWKVGSSWEHQRPDENHTVDISGKIEAYNQPWRLTHGWTFAGQTHHAQVTFDIEKVDDNIAKLTLTHKNMEQDIEREVWAKVLCGLKTLVETGHALPNLMG